MCCLNLHQFDRLQMRLPAQSADLRQTNRLRVLAEIRRAPGISRKQLSQVTGLTEASLSRIARDLIEGGIVSEMDGRERAGARGRPIVGLSLNSSTRYA